MNLMQRYSRELIAANNDSATPDDAGLVWRGQAIERLATHWDESDTATEAPRSWIDKAVSNSD